MFGCPSAPCTLETKPWRPAPSPTTHAALVSQLPCLCSLLHSGLAPACARAGSGFFGVSAVRVESDRAWRVACLQSRVGSLWTSGCIRAVHGLPGVGSPCWGRVAGLPCLLHSPTTFHSPCRLPLSRPCPSPSDPPSTCSVRVYVRPPRCPSRAASSLRSWTSAPLQSTESLSVPRRERIM